MGVLGFSSLPPSAGWLAKLATPHSPPRSLALLLCDTTLSVSASSPLLSFSLPLELLPKPRWERSLLCACHGRPSSHVAPLRWVAVARVPHRYGQWDGGRDDGEEGSRGEEEGRGEGDGGERAQEGDGP